MPRFISSACQRAGAKKKTPQATRDTSLRLRTQAEIFGCSAVHTIRGMLAVSAGILFRRFDSGWLEDVLLFVW